MLCCRSATQWAGLGLSVVFLSPMWFTKIGGASLAGISSGDRLGPRWTRLEFVRPRVGYGNLLLGD
jgi:hypothetical protein